MPLVKIKEKYQVTIPSKIREKLPLKVGDLLEASLERDRIVLKPQVILERSKAVEQLFHILTQRGRSKGVKDREVIEDALEAVREVRRLKHAKRRA